MHCTTRLPARLPQDAACERLAELALNDLAMAGAMLREAVGCSRVAVAAADREDVVKAFQRVGGAARGAAGCRLQAEVGCGCDGGRLELARELELASRLLGQQAPCPSPRPPRLPWWQGLKAALGASLTIKGLLEMMFEVVSEWIDGFLADIESGHSVTPRPNSRRQSAAAERGGAASNTCELLERRQGDNPARPDDSLLGRVERGPPVTAQLLHAQACTPATALPCPRPPCVSAGDPATTFKIRMISHEAQRNASVSEKVGAARPAWPARIAQASRPAAAACSLS